jgi:hypothetical protein
MTVDEKLKAANELQAKIDLMERGQVALAAATGEMHIAVSLRKNDDGFVVRDLDTIDQMRLRAWLAGYYDASILAAKSELAALFGK